MQDQDLQDKHSSRRLPISIVAGISAVVLVAGSATAWWTWNSIASKQQATRVAPAPTVTAEPPATQPPKAETAQPSPQASVKTPVEQTVQIYWVKDTGTRLELTPAPVTVTTAAESGDTLKVAFEELLKGPTDNAIASTIPQNTKLLNLDVREDGVHVDLSKEFVSGGGSASMSGRLAQVIYTATTLDPDAKVWISVDGEPLEVLGGEGLLISQPITRAELDENFPL